MHRAIHLSVFLLFSSIAAQAQPPFEHVGTGLWIKRSPTPSEPVPKFGWEGSGAWDSANRLWIHHAGHDGNPQGFITFTYDLLGDNKWRQMFPPTSPPGVCCVDGANVFHGASGRFVRFPGGSLGHGYQWSRGVKLKESAVWLLDAKAGQWRNMRPAPYENLTRTKDQIGGLNPNGTYDALHELAISFGGGGTVGGKNNLHAYDPWTNTLHQQKPKDARALWPSPRDGCGIAFDTQNEKLVLFGGQYTDDERTWFYDFPTNTWEAHDLSPRPPALKGKKTYSTIPKMTYDSVNRVVTCVVWIDEQGGHETWALDVKAKQWAKLTADGPEPSKSRTRNLDFIESENLAVMETWSVKGEPQLWTYRFAAAPPSARPARVEGLNIVTTPNSALLSWQKIRGAVRYIVHRGAGEKPWEVKLGPLAESQGETYEDKSIQPGEIHTYTVRAVGKAEGPPSFRARTEPSASVFPIVSVTAPDRVEVAWNAHPAPDIAGYNVYRGIVKPRTLTQGTPGAWKDNDPKYEQSVIVGVQDITDWRKLTDKPVESTALVDKIDLTQNPAIDYRFAVYAYVVRAVNRLGVESGASPYAMTIPAEPLQLMCREVSGEAELKWEPPADKGIAGYQVYKLEGGVWGIKRITPDLLKEPRFKFPAGKETTRFWVTAIDALGQEGQPSSPAWYNKSYKGFYEGEWHQ